MSHAPSIFLEPFAPPTLLGFAATMVPLTPARFSPPEQVSLLHGFQLPSVPPPTTPSSPWIALTRYPSAPRASVSRLGFAIARQARQTTWPYRVHLRCGPVVHFPELPTLPRGNAGPFRYRPESVYLKRTCTFLLKSTCKRTGPRSFDRGKFDILAGRDLLIAESS